MKAGDIIRVKDGAGQCRPGLYRVQWCRAEEASIQELDQPGFNILPLKLAKYSIIPEALDK
jgi:hypothetical protein